MQQQQLIYTLYRKWIGYYMYTYWEGIEKLWSTLNDSDDHMSIWSEIVN